MTISFLFPRTGETPIGGFKIVYEYGNRLAADGHTVNYIYGIASRKDLPSYISPIYRFCRLFRYLKYRLKKNFAPHSWFKTEGQNHILSYDLSEKRIPKSDIIIATSWPTAFWLNEYRNISPERKMYFIQHYEDFFGPKEMVAKTWRMQLNKIVIAPWLQQIASDMGQKSLLVENAFNHNEFYLENSIEEREPHVCMLWHENPFKDSKCGLKAILIAKSKLPNLKATIFGVYNRPKNLPEWISYRKSPSISLLRHIYNDSAVFVGSSISEGWGLTVGESMLCGCAVACTNNGGYAVMAKNDISALVSPIKDSEELSKNIIRLIENKELRCRIAKTGLDLISAFTWEKSYEKFKKAISVE